MRSKLAIVLAGLFATTPALAQERFGKSGTLAISAERLFGLVHTSTKFEDEDDDDTSVTVSGTNFSLLVPADGSVGPLYSTPRIGGDYFVIDGLSVGAALGFFTDSSSQEVKAGNVSQEVDGPSVSGILLAPRVGYAFMFQPNIGIWPRGGLTWIHGSSSENEDPKDETTTNVTAFTLEVPLVIAPVPHVAFLVTPALDIGIGGGSKMDRVDPLPDTETDVKSTEFGVTGAITVYF
jgi:hypothetical protein